jgi:hypothetical protein
VTRGTKLRASFASDIWGLVGSFLSFYDVTQLVRTSKGIREAIGKSMTALAAQIDMCRQHKAIFMRPGQFYDPGRMKLAMQQVHDNMIEAATWTYLHTDISKRGMRVKSVFKDAGTDEILPGEKFYYGTLVACVTRQGEREKCYVIFYNDNKFTYAYTINELLQHEVDEHGEYVRY